MKTSLQPDKLLKIYLHYPELNFVWLLIGRETMIRGNTNKSDTNPESTTMESDAKIITLREMLREKEEEITNLKLHIATLETELKQVKQEYSTSPENVEERRRDAG